MIKALFSFEEEVPSVNIFLNKINLSDLGHNELLQIGEYNFPRSITSIGDDDALAFIVYKTIIKFEKLKLNFKVQDVNSHLADQMMVETATEDDEIFSFRKKFKVDRTNRNRLKIDLNNISFYNIFTPEATNANIEINEVINLYLEKLCRLIDTEIKYIEETLSNKVKSVVFEKLVAPHFDKDGRINFRTIHSFLDQQERFIRLQY